MLRLSLLLLVLSSVVISILPQETSALSPSDFYYMDTGELPPVLFSHALHRSRGKTCGDCHSRIFQMKIGHADIDNAMTMKTMEKGKLCGSCHDGKWAFSVKSNCKQCHFK